MKVFHHNDNDGRLSAFLIGHFVRKRHPTTKIEFIESTYDQPFPIDTVVAGEMIWIVDFSIEPAVMVDLLSRTANVRWIDHHGTSIAKYSSWEDDCHRVIEGIRRTNAAACVLTYEYCHKEYLGRRHRSIPMFIKLVGDRDIWAWEYGAQSKFFHRGLQAEDTSPESPVWYDAWKSTAWLEKQGVIVEEGFRRQAYEAIKQCGSEVTFHDYKCFALNASVPFLRSSEYFEEFVPDYDIWISFRYANGFWAVSLYSKTVDTSVIATQYVCNGRRGGGHPLTDRGSASGFQCLTLPWRG